MVTLPLESKRAAANKELITPLPTIRIEEGRCKLRSHYTVTVTSPTYWRDSAPEPRRSTLHPQGKLAASPKSTNGIAWMLQAHLLNRNYHHILMPISILKHCAQLRRKAE